MVITIDEIKDMVVECVNAINEYHHSLDPSIEKLANIVLRKYFLGGGLISTERINKINPYFQAKKPLKVIVSKGIGANVSGKALAAFDRENNSIEIARDSSYLFDRNSLKTKIMHELSHYIDITKRTKFDSNRADFTDRSDEEMALVNDIVYIFKPTEIQARLTEYSYYLKKNKEEALKKPNEKILRLKDMAYFISMLEASDFKNYTKKRVLYLSFLLWFQRKARDNKNMDTSLVNFKNKNLNVKEEEFNSIKEKLVRVFKKRLHSMRNKAYKIKYDAMQQFLGQ